MWYLHNLRRKVAGLLAGLLLGIERLVQNRVVLLALERASRPTVFHGQFDLRDIDIAFKVCS
jgi:hypothetical protein